jgi:predicted nuclease with TOPRIM domain
MTPQEKIEQLQNKITKIEELQMKVNHLDDFLGPDKVNSAFVRISFDKNTRNYVREYQMHESRFEQLIKWLEEDYRATSNLLEDLTREET